MFWELDFLLSPGDSLSWHKFESTFLSIGPQFPKQCFFLSRLPVFTLLSFWLELYENADERGAMVEWFWQVKIEVHRQKPVPELLYSP